MSQSSVLAQSEVQGRNQRRMKGLVQGQKSLYQTPIRFGVARTDLKRYAKFVRVSPDANDRFNQGFGVHVYRSQLGTLSPRPNVHADSMPRDLDLVSVVESVSIGGTKFVRRFWVALHRKGVTRKSLQTLIEAFKEAAQVQSPDVVTAVPRPTTNVAAFVEGANRLDKSGHSDAALDLLYAAIDKMLRSGAFPDVDAILRDVKVADLSMNILIGLLTTTLPVRRRLPARPEFFGRVESILRQRGQLKEGLLAGLEG